jgi:hypothetical protein
LVNPKHLVGAWAVLPCPAYPPMEIGKVISVDSHGRFNLRRTDGVAESINLAPEDVVPAGSEQVAQGERMLALLLGASPS